jgi:hypothetical protein
MIIGKPKLENAEGINKYIGLWRAMMIQPLCPIRPATKQQPIIRVVLHADDLLRSSSIMETIIDALFDHMWQASIVVCVRRTSSEHGHEQAI